MDVSRLEVELLTSQAFLVKFWSYLLWRLIGQKIINLKVDSLFIRGLFYQILKFVPGYMIEVYKQSEKTYILINFVDAYLNFGLQASQKQEKHRIVYFFIKCCSLGIFYQRFFFHLYIFSFIIKVNSIFSIIVKLNSKFRQVVNSYHIAHLDLHLQLCKLREILYEVL